jgi:UDP-N-acetylglucosamine 4,6-dehydratase
MLDNLNILVTGGTGSFGKKFTEMILDRYKPNKLIVFSRDELKQHEMQQMFADRPDADVMRYFIGDIRDKERLYRAFNEVDLVVHTAALKQVPACEYNPFEAILTNIIGAKNIIDAAIDTGVKKVIALSTDKAVNPTNLYGATKLCMEKLFVQAGAYSPLGGTKFAICRYGNVMGSRGSVVPLFIEQQKKGKITITDSRMTRFWITLEQGVNFVVKCTDMMNGGEIFVPKIPSMNIMDVAKIMAPDCVVDFVGIRPGEKLHEVLISEDEARHSVEMDDMYIVKPPEPFSGSGEYAESKEVPEGFRFTSNHNTEWLKDEELLSLVADVVP